MASVIVHWPQVRKLESVWKYYVICSCAPYVDCGIARYYVITCMVYIEDDDDSVLTNECGDLTVSTLSHDGKNYCMKLKHYISMYLFLVAGTDICFH